MLKLYGLILFLVLLIVLGEALRRTGLLGPGESASKRTGGRQPSAHPASGEPLAYRRKDWLVSRAEKSFYGVLLQALPMLPEPAVVMAKVRLADLLYLPRDMDRSTRVSQQNRVNSKHVDFVLCAADTLRPLLAIEIDDSSHDAEDRQERDSFVDAALQAAGLPLVRFDCKRGYSIQALAQPLQRAMEPQAVAQTV
ncbi:MAG TPA: DUF2726 domain-containing protein [Phycisphaerales bacterium]|nr:DUF2726 domain-containing protein [Phycisphaerales bacterium]